MASPAPPLHAHPAIGWRDDPGPIVTLMPGQLYFGAHLMLKTLLGSCVALTLWHPRRHIGGMCHYLLPTRQQRSGGMWDGRYGDEAVAAMVQVLERTGARTSDFIAHLYGGADTMPDGKHVKLNIGERNIEQGWNLIEHYGFQLDGVDVGDNTPRHVAIDLRTGLVEVKRTAGVPAARR